MTSRFHITVGATTTAGGKVISASSIRSINGAKMALAGDSIFCPACKSTGVIEPDGPRISEQVNGRQVALSDDLCRCKCKPMPRLIACQSISKQVVEAKSAAASAEAAMIAASRLNAYEDRSGTTEGLPLLLLDPDSLEPFRHRAYRIELTSGFLDGTTDQHGATLPLTAEQQRAFIRWHVGDLPAGESYEPHSG